jgi:hypothetical protein
MICEYSCNKSKMSKLLIKLCILRTRLEYNMCHTGEPPASVITKFVKSEQNIMNTTIPLMQMWAVPSDTQSSTEWTLSWAHYTKVNFSWSTLWRQIRFLRRKKIPYKFTEYFVLHCVLWDVFLNLSYERTFFYTLCTKMIVLCYVLWDEWLG